MNYYFIGIGGIGMSALARYFKQRGDNVYGYDHAESPLTHQLEHEGIVVHYDDNPAKIPTDIDLCIYTPAVPRTTEVYRHMEARGVKIVKRSQMLGELTRGKRCIAVAGSHGKTTTSGMIVTLLQEAGIAVDAFLGGIHKNLDSNMLCQTGSKYVVVEADEYDRSFLQLHPYLSVITSTDADHLDIYGTHANLLEAFDQFASQTDEDGHIFIQSNASLLAAHQSFVLQRISNGHASCYSGKASNATHHASNIRIEQHGIRFDYTDNHLTINDIYLQSAPYNIENAVAAIAVATACGADADAIRRGMAHFSGIRRRFDYRVCNSHIIYIDDYAHHPRELAAAIDSARQLYPNKRIAGIFQPHLYSRTADFYREFATSLSALDDVTLLDIYPAREEPIAGVSSLLILDNITTSHKRLYSKEQLIQHVTEIDCDVLMTLGAGDIDRLVPTIEEKLLNSK